jgi:hypothetical protein
MKKNFFSFLLVLIFLVPLVVASAPEGNYGLDKTVGVDDLSSALNTEDTDIASKVGKLIGVVLSFVGVIFFILVIYGGFLWMIARGNSGQVEKAKDLLYSAAIGLIIVLSAYAITSFIGSQVTGT